MRTALICIGALLALGSREAQAYHFFEAKSKGCVWPTLGVGNVDFLVDRSASAALGTALLTEATAARTAWNGVSSAKDVIGALTTSAADYTDTNFGTTWGIGAKSGTADGQKEVVLDETGDIFALLSLKANVNGVAVTRRVVSATGCQFADGYLLINGKRTNFDRPSTVVHEFGHMLGLAHSSVGEFNTSNASNGGATSYSSPATVLRSVAIADVPTMHPFSTRDSAARRTLEADDAAGISELYPEPAFATSFGKVSGIVRRCSDDKPLPGVNVRAVNVANTRIQLTRYSAYDGNAQARFDISGLPAGDYELIVEEMGHNKFTPGKMSMVTAAGQGFVTESFGPTQAAETSCSDSSKDPAKTLAVTAGSTSADLLVKVEDRVKFAFVVDDTSSMISELGAVQASVNKLIDRLGASGQPFPRTALITFKDDVTQRLVTDDAAALRAAVGELTPSGGGDCPEASNAALLDAGRMLAEGGKAVLFTDANSAPSGPTRDAVAEYFRSRRLGLSVLLSATCGSEFAPAGAAKGMQYHEREHQQDGAIADEEDDPPVLGPEDALMTYSSLTAATGGVLLAVPRPVDGDRASAYVNAGLNLSAASVLPAVAVAQPGALPQGATATIDLRGSNTNWTNDSTLQTSNAGIVVVSVQVLRPTLMRARLRIASTVPPGFYDFKVVTTLGATSTETAEGTGGLQITAAAAPQLASLSPPDAFPGDRIDVTVYGLGTSFTNASSAQLRHPGSGATSALRLEGVTPISATELRAKLIVDALAPAGLYDLVVDEKVLSRALLVSETPPRVPTITAVDPAVLQQGSRGTAVTVTSTDTIFDDTTTASVSGTGVAIASVQRMSPTRLKLTVDVDASAAPGFRTVTATTDGIVASGLDILRIAAPSPSPAAPPAAPPPQGESKGGGAFDASLLLALAILCVLARKTRRPTGSARHR